MLCLLARTDGRLHDVSCKAYQVRASRGRAQKHGTLRFSTELHVALCVCSAVLALRRDCAGVSTRSGEVDQSGGSMLSDDVQEQGYVLVCASRPLSDCLVKTVPEVRALRYQVLRDTIYLTA